MMLPPCTKMPKVLKSSCRKLWCLSACKNQRHLFFFFWRYCKDVANLLFWECLTISIKINTTNFQETFMLICMWKINFATHFFKTYCKEITNLLFWAIWACLATHKPKMIVSIWRNIYCLSAGKNQVHVFLEISTYPWDIANIFQTCYFGYFEHARLPTPKVILTA